ncbi:MAG: hypothetical protein AABZ60_16630 [Planctomycetota bacterium]
MFKSISFGLCFFLVACTSQPSSTTENHESSMPSVPLADVSQVRSQYQRTTFKKRLAICPVCQGNGCSLCQNTGGLWGYIDWTYGYCYVEGMGLANGIGGQQTLLAKKAAEVTTHRHAIQLLQEMTVEEQQPLGAERAESWYSNILGSAELLSDQSQKFLERQQTVHFRTIRFPFLGTSGLTHHLYPQYQGQSQSKSGESLGTQERYSYVVIDARGKTISPALFPKIWAEEGTLVWDFLEVSKSTLFERGSILYVSERSSELEKSSYRSALTVPSFVRTSSQWNPLKIQAHANTRSYQTDIVIRQEDAETLLANGRLLRSAQIVVLLD